MQISEFSAALAAQPTAALQFVFDDGDTIPAEFHITEVGHVTKRFVDCGGTLRSTESVQLQTWVSPNDPDHRLTAAKLTSILEIAAKSVLPPRDLDVEIEYEGCVVSQFGVSRAEQGDGMIRFHLVDKHTDCLAKESCGIETSGCCGSEAKEGSCC